MLLNECGVYARMWESFKLYYINSLLIRLDTCKNEDTLIKNEGARVLTILHINFSDAQGQVTQ